MKNINKSFEWVIQPILVIGLIVLGIILATSFSMFKEEPEKKVRSEYIPLVRTMTSELKDQNIIIKGNGTLEARTRINLIPQVGGRISYIHPELRAGGKFNANETLLEVESIDYELMVTQNEAEVARAETLLELEKAEADAALEEWFEINPNKPVPTLVGREPQIKEAVSELKSANARLTQAKLDLQRTKVKMPFSGRVVEAMTDIGAVVSANQNLGIIYSTEVFEIPIPMELEKLRWIKSTDKKSGSRGNKVDVHIAIDDHLVEIKGEVTRIESELQSASRFARVVVTLLGKDIPEMLKDKIIPGVFVNTSIYADKTYRVTVLPNKALRRDNLIWLIKNNQLNIISPEIIFQSESEFYVNGLPDKSEVITSTLNIVTDGMTVKKIAD